MEYKKLDIVPNIKNKRNLATSTNIVFGSTLLDSEEYYIRETTLPGITFTSPEVYAPNSPFHTSVQVEPDTVQYDPLEVTLLVDEDLEIWKTVINKSKMACNGDLNTELKDRSRSWILIKDSNGNTRKKIVFRDCVITMIGSLDYSSADNDDLLTLPLTITYSEFDIEDINPPTLRKGL